MRHVMWIAVVLSAGVLVDAAPSRGDAVCPRPNLPDVIYDGDTKWFGSGTILDVTCKKQFVEAYPYITCVDGQWTDPEPPCKTVRCVFPPNIRPGYITVPCRNLNCVTTYDCPPRYTYTGTEKRVCQRNETWTGWTGQCKVIICPVLSHPTHGHVHQREKSVLPATAKVICAEGYIYSEPGHTTRTCQKDETWSGVEGVCEAVLCPELPNPQNGRIEQPSRSYLANATVVCDKGYSETNSTVQQCQGNNTWSGEDGICERRICPELGEIENGVISAPGVRYGDHVEVQCQYGYSLDGPSTIWCQADGRWSTEFGKCLDKGSTSVNLAAIIVPALILFVIVTILVIVIVLYKRRNKGGNGHGAEELSLLGKKKDFHGSFKLIEEFSEEYSDTKSPKYSSFANTITKGIKKAIKDALKYDKPNNIEDNRDEIDLKPKKTDAKPEVTFLYLCKHSRTVYVDIRLNIPTSEDTIRRALRQIANIKGTKCPYHVKDDSITFRDAIQNVIVAGIDAKRHNPDKKGDKRIDLDTEYVRLKLLSNEAMGLMERGDLERPDRYQSGLGTHSGTDIKEDELVRKGNEESFILIRGRAGIGKSTLVQHLLWRWANGEWATQFKALFLVNMRYLMSVDEEIDLPDLLSLYSVYTLSGQKVFLDVEWLKQHQSEIGLVIDGIDEIQDFRNLWQNGSEKDLTDEALHLKLTPFHWCVALMKRDIIKRSTIIITSRPFAGLTDIMTHHKDLLQNKFQLIELMGLTQERVMEFVDKYVAKIKREFVKKTLKNNPILLSVCAITFYCAALCELLIDEKVVPTELTTYSWITFRILQMYLKRSNIDEGETSFQTAWSVMTTLAYNGILRPGIAKLVFDVNDLKAVNQNRTEIDCIRKTGLLVDTHIQDPKDPKQTRVLSQFVHLSIQEFLAMGGLWTKDDGRMKDVVTQLSGSQQFNMALLFLYGIAFDESEMNKMVSSSSGRVESQHIEDKRQILTTIASGVSDKLQAMQICHESQCPEIAKAVGKRHFGESVYVGSVKLTVIDIKAMVFMLKHHTSANTIALDSVDIDVVSMKEIGFFLQNDKNITTLGLYDDNIDDECVAELMQGIKYNTTLETLDLSSGHITDAGVETLAAVLGENNTLQTLDLSSNYITDSGVETLAAVLGENSSLHALHLHSTHITDAGVETLGAALGENNTLQALQLWSSSITDDGVVHLTQGLMENTNLKKLRLYKFTMGDKGVRAVLDMLSSKQDLKIVMRLPSCNESLKNEVDGHKRIKFKSY